MGTFRPLYKTMERTAEGFTHDRFYRDDLVQGGEEKGFTWGKEHAKQARTRWRTLKFTYCLLLLFLLEVTEMKQNKKAEGKQERLMPIATDIWKKWQKNRASEARPVGSEIKALSATSIISGTEQTAGLCPTQYIKCWLLESFKERTLKATWSDFIPWCIKKASSVWLSQHITTWGNPKEGAQHHDSKAQ